MPLLRQNLNPLATDANNSIQNNFDSNRNRTYVEYTLRTCVHVRISHGIHDFSNAFYRPAGMAFAVNWRQTDSLCSLTSTCVFAERRTCFNFSPFSVRSQCSTLRLYHQRPFRLKRRMNETKTKKKRSKLGKTNSRLPGNGVLFLLLFGNLVFRFFL